MQSSILLDLLHWAYSKTSELAAKEVSAMHGNFTVPVTKVFT